MNLRIFDSNINRVCEGFRVIEDILRFNYNSEELSKKIKEQRHKVRNICDVHNFNLLNYRDVKSDVGPEISKEISTKIDNTVLSLIIGNFKRIQEGLRSLEEISKTIAPIINPSDFEKIRYLSYDLEKDIIGFITRNNFILPALYGITFSEESLGRSTIDVVTQMIKSGIKLIQYREKNLSLQEKYYECLEIRKLTKEYGVSFIINDHIDLAILVNADGVHLGQNDIPLKEARRLLGSNKIIGISTHNPKQAQKAVEDGADYIGVGPIFFTRTKKDVCDPVGLSYLKWVKENIKIPYVAIGGIKEHNLKDILHNGAGSIALVSEITGSSDINQKITNIYKLLGEK